MPMLALVDAPAASMACLTMPSRLRRSSRLVDAEASRSGRLTRPVAVMRPFHAVNDASSSKALAMVVTRV